MALLVKSHIPNWSHTSSSGSFPHSRNTGLSSVSQTQHVYSWTPNLHPCYWFCPESFFPPLYSTLLFLPVFLPFWFLPFLLLLLPILCTTPRVLFIPIQPLGFNSLRQVFPVPPPEQVRSLCCILSAPHFLLS